jgi:hypothetical protein
MVDTAWLAEARRYGAMNERSRATYWRQLSSEQQAALEEALNALSTVPQNRVSSSGRT